MELNLDNKGPEADGMRRIHKTMQKYFGDTVCLAHYWGPEQMRVFALAYNYSPESYQITLECERGFLTLSVKDETGNTFTPWILYPEIRRYLFEDKSQDIEQLVSLTHQAISKNEIRFFTSDERNHIASTVSFEYPERTTRRR